MKKVWLLILMLFLTACGGGGGSTVSGGGNATGTVSMQFVDKTAKTVAATVPDPGFVRVVVTNSSLNGSPYKQVMDVPFGSGSVVMTIPVGNGFAAEAVYYSKSSSGLNRLSDYGAYVGTFNIVENQQTSVPITMGRISVSMDVSAGSLYTTAPSNTYSVTATIGAGLQSAWSLATDDAPFTAGQHLATRLPVTSYSNIAVPSTLPMTTPYTLYLQGEFFIKNEMLQSGESPYNWVYYFDDAAALKKDVLVHSGNTTIATPDDGVAPTVTSFSVPSFVLTSTTVSPISIAGTDNTGIVGYQITTTPAAPALATPGTGGWSATKPTSFTVPGTPAHGVNNTVTLYAWVEDLQHVSTSVAKDVVINDSPAVNGIVVPSSSISTTVTPITGFTGLNYTGDASALKYLITDAMNSTTRLPIAPDPTDPAWSSTPPTSFGVTSITQLPGGHYAVPIYAWVMDGNSSISRPLTSIVNISDAPSVTAFTVPTSIASGTVVPISAFTGAATGTHNIAGYLVTKTSAVPAASAFSATAPTEFNIGPISAGSRYLYAWVKDERDVISLSRSVVVKFLAP